MKKLTIIFAIVLSGVFASCTKQDAAVPVNSVNNRSIAKNPTSINTATFVWTNATGVTCMINGTSTSYAITSDSINVSVNTGDVIQMSDANPTNLSMIKLKMNFNAIATDSIRGTQGVLENRFQYIVQ